MKMDDIDRIKNNLPRIPGIHSKDEYFNSVVLLLLVKIQDEYHIILEERGSSIKQGGEICFPGGKREEDEPIELTAVRETTEEIGIPGERIQIVGQLDTVVASMGAVIDVFVGVTDMDVMQLTINPTEVERVFTLPLSYFKNNQPEEYSVMVQVHSSYRDTETDKEVVLLPVEELGLPSRYHTPWGGYKNKIFVYRTPEGIIWGITARILYDFCKRLI